MSDPLRPRAAVVTLVASGLATLVNPFGPGVYCERLRRHLQPGPCGSLIAEWQSPDFHDPAMLAVIMLPVAVTVAYLAFSARPVPALELALAAFLLVSSPGRGALHPLLRHRLVRPGGDAARPSTRERLRPSLLVWPLVAVLGLSLPARPVLSGRQARAQRPGEGGGLPRAPPGSGVLHLPVERLPRLGGPAGVRRRPHRALHRQRRAVAVPGHRQPHRRPRPALAPPTTSQYVLWPTHSALALYLEHDPHWRVVWHSSSAVVLRAS